MHWRWPAWGPASERVYRYLEEDWYIDAVIPLRSSGGKWGVGGMRKYENLKSKDMSGHLKLFFSLFFFATEQKIRN